LTKRQTQRSINSYFSTQELLGSYGKRYSGGSLTKSRLAQVESVVSKQKRGSPQLPLKKAKPSHVAHVGIIFVVDDRVLIESTPISKGEVYGEAVNHARGHEVFWAQLQVDGLVPQDQDYITAPRGRAIANRLTGRPSLYLDKCIIKKPALVREIKRRLHLPARVEISRDLHYRCEACLCGRPL
jgi:hypothetical protein